MMETLSFMETIAAKVKPVEELTSVIRALKKSKKKIVHCHGVFDLLHPGHLRHLAAAKKNGDILVVSITADKFVRRGPGRPIFNEELRAEALASLAAVDFVAIDRHFTAVEVIKALQPDVYVKGQDYAKKENDVTGKITEEEEAVKSVGGSILFTNDITFSSTKLINEHLDVLPELTKNYLKGLSSKYPVDYLSGQFAQMKKLKVLVIGDAIIDEYHYCESMGKSLKEHLVVSKFMSKESFAGGVFATANNTAQVCGDVELITMLGQEDSQEEFIRNHMAPNIYCKFFYRPDAPTTIKRRYINSILNQKLFEICFMDDRPIAADMERELLAYLKTHIAKFDMVIVSDFGHGLLTQAVVDFVCSQAKFLAINVQTNSANTGFNLVIKYPKADYVTVDEPEMRLAAHDKHGDLKMIMKDIATKMNYNHLMVTRGHQGSYYYDAAHGVHETPCLSSKVVDRIGAGDAFFAYTAPCCFIGMPNDLLSCVGNAVGALKVQIVCNRTPVDKVDLMKFLICLLK